MSKVQSLRTRFAVAAGIAGVLLLGILGYAHWLAQSSAEESRRQIKTYYDSHRVLRNARSALRTLEAELRERRADLDGLSKATGSLEAALAVFEERMDLVLAQPVFASQAIFSGLTPALEDMGDRLHDALDAGAEADSDVVAQLFSGLHKTLHLTERRFYDGVVDQTFQAVDASHTLNRVIWILAGGTFVALMLAYLLFELSIRRPLLLVAEALRAEGQGEGDAPDTPHPRTIEIRFLVDAFNSMRQQVHSRQLRLHSVLESASDGIITFDLDGTVESINSAGERLLGVDRERVIGRNILEVFPLQTLLPEICNAGDTCVAALLRHQGQELEIPVERSDGNTLQLALKLSDFSIAERRYFNALVSDITERKQMIDRLTYLAQRDTLTGLYNRRQFFEELQKAVDLFARDSSTRIALISIDLDRFKYVNDTMGHQAGDLLLKEVARVLSKRCRRTDVLARLGGDEFVVLLRGSSGPEALQAAEGYRRALADFHFSHDGKAAELGCSIGVVELAADVDGPEDLMVRADIAMRAAKQAGRNRVHLFEGADLDARNRVADSMSYAQLIDDALSRERIFPAFQPVFDLRRGRVVGFEVLARITRAEGEAKVPIGTLVGVAERFGLAVEIDRRILSLVTDALRRSDEGLGGRWLSFNLSAQSIVDEQILATLQSLAEGAVLPKGSLVFEITETTAIASLRATQAFLRDLRALGCLAALDDFGTGYSSFTYLRELSLDFVKLDRTYVTDVHKDPLHRALIEAVHSVALAMGAKTVAEGVENDADYRALRAMGIDFAQGYLFGAPCMDLPWLRSAEPSGDAYLPYGSPWVATEF